MEHENGQVLYSKYVCTDASTALLNEAKQRLGGIRHLEFDTLDISKDLESQGFEERNFDLVVVFGVIHTTPHVQRSLQNLRRLLWRDGRLFCQQPEAGHTWIKSVLGLLPSWWCGIDDERQDEPYIRLDRWKSEPSEAGFGDGNSCMLDSRSGSHFSSLLVARPRQRRSTMMTGKNVELIYRTGEESTVTALQCVLEARGSQVSSSTIDQALTARRGDAIALVDRRESLLEDMDAAEFESLKALVARTAESGSGIFWVTKPSQTRCPDPRYSPVVGLARTLRAETGVDFATCEVDDMASSTELEALIDVFDVFHSRTPDASPDFEDAIVGGVTYVGRVIPFPYVRDGPQHCDMENMEASLQVGRPGHLHSLEWVATKPKTTLTGTEVEVEVEVHVVGLNFRNVLEAMGILSSFDKSKLGLEGWRRTDPDVTEFAAGDRVMATGTGVFSTTLISHEAGCVRLPDNLSFTEGASMAVVFQTAIHGLITIGRLTKGQSVLIHSGCGGVGMAAIQVARMFSADIYITVGNEEKIDYLSNHFGIPRTRMFSSRSAGFAESVLRQTNGQGVDLALNSLSGELLHATWRCIAKWGTMVEIGKVDLVGAGRLDMERFVECRNYSSFDMRQMSLERPLIAKRLLQSMLDYFQQGAIGPIPIARVFVASDVQDAFRYMQQDAHIGKVVVTLRDRAGKSNIGTVSSKAHNEDDGLDPLTSYLLVGGLGGLGCSIAVWMVQRGARYLTFLSRGAESQENRDFTHMLQHMGCDVKLVAGSVTNLADVRRAMEQDGGGAARALKGIIHMGMVLRDRSFSFMSMDDWREATGPKVAGTWNLHEASRGMDLDFFILLSSLSGVLGQPGQANYAAANTFLDAFAGYRRSMGLPCTSLALGAMEGVGYLLGRDDLLRKMRGTGWSPAKEEELIEAIRVTMVPDRRKAAAQTNQPAAETTSHSLSPVLRNDNIFLGLRPSNSLGSDGTARLSRDVRMAAYLSMGNSGTSGEAPSGSAASLQLFLAEVRRDPATLQSPEAAVALGREVGNKLNVLLLRPDAEVKVTAGLAELGLDSLTGVEMRSWLKHMFGVDMSVLEILGTRSLEALGKRLAENMAETYG